ncbi:MAG: hypothetical protein M0C28_04005 [Candidatus Moduliflexus flocculans]|nr:hypothetical protein [Candidatus Moduliflexus flocculans]
MSENHAQEAAKTALSGGPALLPFKSLRGKATLYVLLLLAGTVVAAYVITLRTMNGHVREEIVKRAESLSRSIASAAGYNLILDDVLALDNMVFKIKDSNPDILSIAIVGPDKKAIVHSEAERAGTALEPSQGRIVGRGADGTWIKEIGPRAAASFAVESPIVFMDKNLGSVVLDVDWSVLAAARADAKGKLMADLRPHPRARRRDERLALVEPDPAGQGAGLGRRGAQAGEAEQASPRLLRRRTGAADGQLQRDVRAHHRPEGEARPIRPRARGGLRLDDPGPGRGHRGPGRVHAGALDAGRAAGRGAGPGARVERRRRSRRSRSPASSTTSARSRSRIRSCTRRGGSIMPSSRR